MHGELTLPQSGKQLHVAPSTQFYQSHRDPRGGAGPDLAPPHSSQQIQGAFPPCVWWDSWNINCEAPRRLAHHPRGRGTWTWRDVLSELGGDGGRAQESLFTRLPGGGGSTRQAGVCQQAGGQGVRKSEVDSGHQPTAVEIPTGGAQPLHVGTSSRAVLLGEGDALADEKCSEEWPRVSVRASYGCPCPVSLGGMCVHIRYVL